MPQLHQIQMKYVPVEDRILLRIRTTDNTEFRFWLTRRYVKLLWPIVVKMLEADENVQLQKDPGARTAVLSFQHEKAVQESDFTSRFGEETSHLPLGDSPRVLARIRLKQPPRGDGVLCMHPETGEGIELAMNEKLLHSFCKLLTDSVKGAGWDVELRLSPGAAGTDAAPKRMN